MTFRPARVLAAVVLAALVGGGLAACASTTTKPVVAPITRSITSLQGTTVKIPLNTILNITTGKVSVTSYTGVIADQSVAIFTSGIKQKGAEFDPGVAPVKVGETKVTVTSASAGQTVTFTVDVVKP